MTSNKVFYLLSTLEQELRTNHPVEAYLTLQLIRDELEGVQQTIIDYKKLDKSWLGKAKVK